jgi:hypothetical protein
MGAPTVNVSISTTAEDTPRTQHVLHRWPSVLGLGTAGLVLGLRPDADAVASGTGVALLCYLAAAASNRRWAAWAGCVVFPAVVVASRVIGVAWWAVGGAVALALVLVGLLLRVPRPPLAAQTAALLGYGSVSVAALFLAPRVGLVLAGVALVAHSVWDVIHYHRNQVVHRSLAEFCITLDVPLGVGAIILAL